jgi:hypothetical protein
MLDFLLYSKKLIEDDVDGNGFCSFICFPRIYLRA